MDMVKLTSMEDMMSLPLTSWNIRQPADEDNTREEALETGGLDLILMPGLGFDRNGNREGLLRHIPGPLYEAPQGEAVRHRSSLQGTAMSGHICRRQRRADKQGPV